MLHCRALVAGLVVLHVLMGAMAPATAQAQGSTVEIAGGGLAFAATPSVVVETQDTVIAPDKIAITYALRNQASISQSFLITFSLPELDAAIVWSNEVVLDKAEPENFVRSETLVDGQPITLKFEQRAFALGLDVTDQLIAAFLPLFPFAPGLNDLLRSLEPARRLDLLERGILRLDGANVVPAWTLKSVGYWRQTINAAQIVTIAHAYQPISGISDYATPAFAKLRKRMCVTPAQEAAIARLAAGGPAPKLASVVYLVSPGADGLGPANRFRLIIEAGDPDTIVASCREGMKRTGPLQFEFSANDYSDEDDLLVLFAR
jgi:hypothetical protein